ncbi:hexokinase [Teratosphaeria nubilosa]|uniref:Phosphotransferase n=1 Tax=Teratosphaeria nubilosa TaxID=161662 RepID=A0A6G1KT91_9PEZI|nr:hexokinase [Teratosphaeria nubilosa]
MAERNGMRDSAVDGIDHLSPALRKQLDSIEEQFEISAAKLKEMVARFREELQEGLGREGANLSMYVTWTLGFPSGSETGSYIAVDLGGTNLRVCWITLHGRGQDVEIEQTKYKLPQELRTDTAEHLWDTIAEKLQDFIEKHRLHKDGDYPLPLGFTFSYPTLQDYVDQGKLKTWTKGWDVKGVEGEDVSAQFRTAISKRKLPVKLVALINDTVGAMIASAYNDKETIIGAIFGTGCNAAYMDHVGTIPKLKTSLPKETPMAINCEYGAFDNARRVLPLTKYDLTIDEQSPRPGEQTFEKMSAGLYLGEIFRLIIIDLHDRGLIFKGQNVSKLRDSYALDTEFLSSLEDDPLKQTRTRFEDQLNVSITYEELQLMHRLAEIVALRGARLCTAGIAAICLKKGIASGHVAADGSVANKHPKFKARWAQALSEVLDWPSDRKEDPIIITSAEDGSGVGAAVIAAMTLERAKKGIKAGIQEEVTDVADR